MTNLLEVENLRTSFATEDGLVTAVDGVSFTVRRGEVLGIVGESGCGKSVTAESVMRLLDEDSTTYEGSVSFEDNVELLDLPEEKMRRYRGGRLGMIFQDPMSALNPVYTVANQLVEALRNHTDLDKKGAYDKALEMLTLTKVPDPELRMKQYPHQLSGGQRQRVMIAMALCCEPDLIIADEPTTALDVTTQAKILDMMADLRQQFDVGTMFITHDLGVVAEICDRVIVMYLGQVIEETDVYTLFNTPAHPYTRGLLASTPSVGSDPAQDLPNIPGAVPTLKQVPYGCRFAARCPFAIDACREAPVPLDEYAGVDAQTGVDHRVRCIRAEEIPGIIAAQERQTSDNHVDDYVTDVTDLTNGSTRQVEAVGDEAREGTDSQEEIQ